MRRHILYVSVILVLLFAVTYVEAVEVPVFEKTYVRGTGQPITETDTFTVNAGPATIKVSNGGLEDADTEMVSSSEISLNGSVIIDESNFNQNVDVIEVEQELSGGVNTIDVILMGKPGGTLTVQVLVDSITEIHITSPIDGSTINSSDTLVIGTISSSAQEVGVIVNGSIAEIVGSEFVANGIYLETGANTITAIATDGDGNTSTDIITVQTNEYQNLASLSANVTSGISPLDVKFSIDTQISNPITTYEIDYEGDGTNDLTIVDPDNVTHTYAQEGIYYPTITVTDDQNIQYTNTIAISVLSMEEIDTLLKAKWDDLGTALISGNIDKAVALFDEGFREVYREQFNGLSSILNTIGNELGYLRLVAIRENSAEYEIIVTRDGTTYSYMLQFVKDKDGLWKIRAF